MDASPTSETATGDFMDSDSVHFAVHSSNKQQGFGCFGDQTLAVVASHWDHSARTMEVQLKSGIFAAVSLTTTFHQLQGKAMGDGSAGKPFTIRIVAAGPPAAGASAGTSAGAGGTAAGSDPRFGVSSKGTGMEGLNGRLYRSERLETVQGVWGLVEENGFVLIKAPPQSGKTSLLQLVLNHALTLGYKGYLVNCSMLVEGDGLKLDSLLASKCGGTLASLMDEDRGGPVVLALDEAQIIYKMNESGSKAFWASLKRLQGNFIEFNVRVVLAAAYGGGVSSAEAGSAPHSPAATPADVDTSETSVSIHPAQDGGVSLRLPQGEVDELWNAWLGATALVRLDVVVKNHITALCASQVGLMVFCLDFLSKHLVNAKLSGSSDQQTQEALSLLASPLFYYDLQGVRSLRTMPSKKLQGVLRKLLWVDSVVAGPPLDGRTVRHLVAGGMAYLDPHGRLRLTSPLHKVHLMRQLYDTGPSSLPLPRGDMKQLLTRLVECLDPQVLALTLSVGSDRLILERCWQMEVYRACSSILPDGTAMSPDVGQALGGQGFLDFYISEPYCVGLELTREGSAITEHLGRFLDPSKYQPMLDCGAVKDHAVVDFRCPPQTGIAARPRKADPNLYTVQFLSGFTSALIWHQGACEEVHVHGRAKSAYLIALSAATGLRGHETAGL